MIDIKYVDIYHIWVSEGIRKGVRLVRRGGDPDATSSHLITHGHRFLVIPYIMMCYVSDKVFVE